MTPQLQCPLHLFPKRSILNLQFCILSQGLLTIPKTWKKTASYWPYTEFLVMSTGPEGIDTVCQILIMDRVSLLKHILYLYMKLTKYICSFKQTRYYNLNGVVIVY